MATHVLTRKIVAVFDDGKEYELGREEKTYSFSQQKSSYIIAWLEALIRKENITSKCVEIRESYGVEECEPYQIRIGL